jgi:endonuclease/exonuclease/phosphatase family metal-dependent hydrolase
MALVWVAALIVMIFALPSLLARLRGGYPPSPGPDFAALAPLAVVPAILAVIIAGFAAWWLAVAFAVPAALLVTWQLPPLRRPSRRAQGRAGSAAATVRLRLFTLNVKHGKADPAAVVRILQQNDVDVFAVQELTPPMASRLRAVGLTQLLPFSHLDPGPRSRGTGLWARWPLTPLPQVPETTRAAPRAYVNPPDGFPVVLSAVHPVSPIAGRAEMWRSDLEMIRRALATDGEPHVVAGDFNASRDHKLFREILAAGFLDCADASRRRPWPGFTWPSSRPVMRLDHVLVSRPATVRMARTVRVPYTDHLGVLVDIEFTRGPAGPAQ